MKFFTEDINKNEFDWNHIVFFIEGLFDRVSILLIAQFYSW